MLLSLQSSPPALSFLPEAVPYGIGTQHPAFKAERQDSCAYSAQPLPTRRRKPSSRPRYQPAGQLGHPRPRLAALPEAPGGTRRHLPARQPLTSSLTGTSLRSHRLRSSSLPSSLSFRLPALPPPPPPPPRAMAPPRAALREARGRGAARSDAERDNAELPGQAEPRRSPPPTSAATSSLRDQEGPQRPLSARSAALGSRSPPPPPRGRSAAPRLLGGSERGSEGSCVPSSPAPGCCCRFGASSPAHHGQAERSVPCFVALGALFHWLPSLHFLHGVHNPSATLVFLCLFYFFFLHQGVSLYKEEFCTSYSSLYPELQHYTKCSLASPDPPLGKSKKKEPGTEPNWYHPVMGLQRVPGLALLAPMQIVVYTIGHSCSELLQQSAPWVPW